MNFLIETLNRWAERALSFAWPMFWQSSLLVGLLLAFELVFRRRVRPAVRYALWCLVLVKLLIPPTLALPSGISWWVRSDEPSREPQSPTTVLVRYGPSLMVSEPLEKEMPPREVPQPTLSFPGWMLVIWGSVSVLLLGWIVVRWRQVACIRSESVAAPSWLNELLEEARHTAGRKHSARLLVVKHPISPAVYGLIRPVILIPGVLVSELSQVQLRGAILHELIHLRRYDVWVNFCQAVLQAFYWWHPLVWLANVRIRWAREEAVDDAAVLALRGEAETYPEMLLQVGRLVVERIAPTLGLVGILETRSALRRRIERLLDFQVPTRTGLTLGSTLGVLTFAALALPMGEAPRSAESPAVRETSAQSGWPDERFQGYSQIKLEGRFFSLDEASLRSLLPEVFNTTLPAVFASNHVAEVSRRLRQANARPNAPEEPMGFAKFSGGAFSWLVGGCTNNLINYLTRETDGRTVVIGAEAQFTASDPDWVPLKLSVVPWSAAEGTGCQMKLTTAATPNSAREAEVMIPLGGVAVWAFLVEPVSHRYELVVLSEGDSHLDDSADNAGTSVSNVPPQAVQNPASSTADSRMRDRDADHAPSRARTTSSAPVTDRPRNWREGKLVTGQKMAPAEWGRQRVVEKLQSIRLERIQFDYTPLSQVVRFLSDAAEKRDPEKLGININLDSNATNLDTVHVTIRPSLVDIRLADAIDAIVKVAEVPLKYSIVEDGVIFSFRNVETMPLYTRIIKVDAQALSEVTRSVLGRDRTAPLDSNDLRNFFHTLGLDLRPPKNLSFNDREDSVLIRGTLADLDTCETALMFLMASSQSRVKVQAQFIQLPPFAAKAFWAQFALSNSPTDGTRMVYLDKGQATQQLNRWKSELDPAAIQSMQVSTLSGRQVEFQIVDTTNVYPKPGADQSIITPGPTGPRVDLTPFVATDGSVVRMMLSASVDEFLGYDDPGQFVPQVGHYIDDRVEAKPLTAQLPLPHFRLVRLPSNGSKIGTTVPAGQTVVLGGFENQNKADQVPVFGGDRPLLGRLFQTQPDSSRAYELILFLTPTVLNGR